MRTLIILMATIVFVAKGLAQNKTADLEQSFMANLKLVGKEEATTITPDSVVVVKYYKPARKKGLYQFDLYRVEEYYTPNSSPENLKKRSIMAATHVLITMKEGAGASDLQGIFSESLIGTPKRIPNSNTYIVPVNPEGSGDAVEKLTTFNARNLTSKAAFERAIKQVEYDYILFADVIPNDSHFAKLWALDNTGAGGGTPDADIDAVEAWDKTTGNVSVVIGIIDTGIDYKHQDLQGNIWENAAEANGKKNVDDDNNGYVDDICGWNFYSNTANPRDDHSHGTHVAGTIGARGNNGKGVSGVSWNVKMVPLKFLGSMGSGSTSGAIAAISYANRIPNLIATNNSWGGGGFSQALKDAIDEAAQRDILFIAAAGNNATNIDITPSYPASYNCPNMIAVAATDRNDELAGFSNYGKRTVHIGAPGDEIYSSVLKNKYASYRGTSMAAPHVTGTCVLLKSLFPQLSMLQVKDKILTMSDPKPSLTTKTITGARLNANGSMTATATVK
jgi:large repetitive protein